MSETIFENDPLIQRATLLSLIIIGEETGKINKVIKEKYTVIPWEVMAGMRNKMVHNYDGIDTAIVWKTITDDIPMLKKEIENILFHENDLLDNK